MSRRRSHSRVSSCSDTFDLTTFGEALLRFLPASAATVSGKEKEPSAGDLPAGCEVFIRTVAGAEVNVAVALGKLGLSTNWVSVLPEGPLGDQAVADIKGHGVDMRFCLQVSGAEMGVMHVLPETRSVHYQRSNSAFARMQAQLFDWFSVACSSRWVHVTGITPMLGQAPRAAWSALLEEAKALDVPTSIDLNHRPALSSLDELLYVISPHLPNVQLLILSRGAAIQIVRKLVKSHANTPDDELLDQDSVVADLRKALRCPTLAISCSVHHDDGEQSRWSVVANETAVVSTKSSLKRVKVVENLGGGDAWVAGFLHVLLTANTNAREGLNDGALLKQAAARGDLLASLAQQELGDFSSVTLSQLEAAESST